MLEKYIVPVVALSWGIFELINGIKRQISSKVEKNKDKGSLILFNVSIGLGYVISFNIYFNQHYGILFRNPIYLLIFGLFFIILGIIIRISAILTLKGQFTYSVTIVQNHKIYDRGIYKFIRHPAYLGSLLALSGSGIAMNNWICICIMIIPTFISISYRIYAEEKALIEHFGSKYIEYMNKTKRLIPFIY